MSRIAIIDFETTGLEPDAKVVERGRCDLEKDFADGWIIQPVASALHFCAEIPPAARAIHHIRAKDTEGFAPFDPDAFWAELKDGGVDAVATHNAAYDGQYWGAPQLPVICTLKVSRRLWPDAPSHGNGALRYWLQDRGLLRDLSDELSQPSHRAGPDAYVTAHILRHMLTGATGNQMVAWTKEPLLQPRITFGKHKGEWRDAPDDYLAWIMRSDMDVDTKWNAQREIDRRREP
jgi:exodeoxyribonuclease X